MFAILLVLFFSNCVFFSFRAGFRDVWVVVWARQEKQRILRQKRKEKERGRENANAKGRDAIEKEIEKEKGTEIGIEIETGEEEETEEGGNNANFIKLGWHFILFHFSL